MRGGMARDDRLSPAIEKNLVGRADFQAHLGRSPLKISSTAQLYKAEPTFGLSPRRTKLDKMGSESMELQKAS